MSDAELPDDPDGAGDTTGDTLDVPDDISSLGADVLAFRREQTARRRRQRWDRATRWARRMRWHDVSVPVMVAVLLVVAGLGAMLVLLGPRGTLPASDSSSGGIVGRPGGTVLSVELTRADGSHVGSTSLGGPAAILLVPTACGCTDTVDAVTAAADHAALRAYVVVHAPATTGPDEYADGQGVLLTQYGHQGATPTLLRIDEHGVVVSVRVGLTADRAVTAVGPV